MPAIDEASVRSMLHLTGYLLKMTADGAIAWHKTNHERRYVYSGESSSVWIETSSRAGGKFGVTLTLLTPEGQKVETLATGVRPNGAGAPEEYTWNAVLYRLYDLARRSALGVDDLVARTIADAARVSITPHVGPER